MARLGAGQAQQKLIELVLEAQDVIYYQTNLTTYLRLQSYYSQDQLTPYPLTESSLSSIKEKNN